MLSPNNQIPGRSETTTVADREQQRLKALADLGLLEVESVTVFEEATQIAAHLLDTTICVLGIVDHEREWFKSAVGLSRIGVMNQLAASRQIAKEHSLAIRVVESQQVLAVANTLLDPDYAENLLVQKYGIRAYLGVPLITSSGLSVGVLAIMELVPRSFTSKEIECLELITRWCMSEYERILAQRQVVPSQIPTVGTSSIRPRLLSQMAQELRTPLTSIMGMASVLMREIYGPLTDKQKEYMDIVHHSGQQLLTLVNEILELGALNDVDQSLTLAPVDIEMLSQQVINTLIPIATRRSQQCRLTTEPGQRVWILDKEKVRQMLYHLLYGVIETSNTDSIIRLHLSRRQDRLHITVWSSHPWLGEGMAPEALSLPRRELSLLSGQESAYAGGGAARHRFATLQGHEGQNTGVLAEKTELQPEATATPEKAHTRQTLGLMLSQHLAELHGGSLRFQESLEAGYRYIITLPLLTAPDS